MNFGQPEGNKADVQGGSWIPATPMKPILPKPPLQPLIYARMDRNQPRPCWLGSERLFSNSNKEVETSSRVACYGGANSMGADGSSEWAAARAGQFQVACNENGTVGIHSMDALGGIPFLQLMALADAASIVGADAALGGNASDLFDSGSSYQIELESSSTKDRLSGSCIPEATEYGISDHGGQHTYDLNFPSGTESHAAAIRITSQFAPLTPDMGKIKYTERDTEVQQIPTENKQDEREQNHNCNTSIIIDGENLKENKELLEPAMHSTITATCTPDGKEGKNDGDLNKTPASRQRRRKHRPKVIIEGKTKRTKPNLKTPSSNPSMRKRVRKSGVSKPSATPPIEVIGETSDQEMLKHRRKSCRRAINFDTQAQTRDGTFESGPLEQGSLTQNIQSTTGLEEVRLEEVGSSTDPNWSMNQMLKRYESVSEKQALTTELSAEHNSSERKQPSKTQMENNTEQIGKVISNSEKGNVVETMLNNDNRSLPGSSHGLIFCKNPTMTSREQATCCLRKRSRAIKQAHTGSINLTGAHYNTLSAYQSMSWMHFPHIYKKKRTEKGQNPVSSSAFTTATHFMRPESACSFNDPQRNYMVSKSNNWIAGPQFNICKSRTVAGHGGNGVQDKLQTYGGIMALGQTEKTIKKPRTAKRLSGLAPSERIGHCEKQPIYPTNHPPLASSAKNINTSGTCINGLFEMMHATVAKKKRTKKKPSNSALLNVNKDLQDRRFVSFHSHQFFLKTLGTAPEHVNQMCFIDLIVEQLKHLDINKESNHLGYREQALVSYNIQNQEQNAIVVYGRDGTIVPFNPIKKRRPRPKVELDEETGRVWKLLMGNINSEGIDGTDEEKIKWWEEERKVFRGRADSFIARMHLVQGDRRFSQWKGSVVDSVVGVFLTQNVSDHLSSSAFMSLAARFPPKPKCHQASCSQEPIIELDEPEECMLNLENGMNLNKQILHQQISEEGSMKKNEMRKSEGRIIVDNNESSGSNVEDGSSNKGPEKISYSSSHNILETCSNSVGEISLTGTSPMQACLYGEKETVDSFSCQDCLDLSIPQTSESIEPSSEGNSEDLPSCSTEAHIDSSEELIQMARLNTLNANYTIDTSVDQSENTTTNKLAEKCDGRIDDTFQPDDPEISLKDSIHHLSGYQMQQNQTSKSLEVDCCQTCNGVQTSNDCQNKDEHFHTEQSTLTVESDNHYNVEIELVVDIVEAPSTSSELSINAKEPDLTLQSQGSVIEDPQNVESPVECTNNVHEIPPNATEMAIQSNPKEYDQLSNEFKEMNPASSRSQRKQVAKEKENNINWDNLRKQTETNGKTRQRTENTMDSLDWEAIRCADVNEIAHAIRERGMNNMLAERIKDFLNRLVKDHGSIDLEWLRDVEPDQAKEYLLSIRGLGLKSVECVRLLTLHHLAFPVDTNVGRIAVRLGWVPLQPLPESLQLHLLELYPVLESIQKYLWPRLCKLDQRTLYELHYQMITFGKVFCTKSKPNCNACPMRGECRHFASAFASARLGLPAPEDKRIVSTTECREPDDNQARTIDQPMLSLPPSTISSEEIKPSETHQSDGKTTGSTCVPIIEEPATPEQESTTQDAIIDIEDAFYEDPDEIPTIKLNIEEFSQNLQNYVQKNMELQEGDMSKALIALTPEAASIPMPKLKNVSRLRTEHQVYELPDSHPLLEKLKLDRREPDDPSSYLLAIWTPGETANSIQLPERRCNQEHHQLCHEEECLSCNSVREANSFMVRGTILIPCRTAMRGSFPLNGTYFQVNEVFADHESSLNPIDVPRDWIWNLPRRTVYFGTSIPTIFKGLSTQGIQHCFWRGFVCVRGFDQKTRAPRPLMARLHFPASKLNRGRGKTDDQ
ncbi:DNA glycosylase/AP lyase ROS1-like [Benincasa hispida]|uniref:DNA glycosylase/AP lyase ROS1-like n=1 Tax=Benincasa hispida TaxID=102211 RepID=UPI0019005503|nr:DNA glycosylase/AP lyase ROS1-like [Benincasa hispida]XP_038904009.1 DNA glycosylase/AP lyase ROS1-like [Benincasa hispida]XP_038904010.1 DNA glycosylase/AP lyase ROS1-like [Benincasa hispida]XP_038904011.1 DNA glycosylase/AP lyase ROS1-like [Benincasa hispida]XP_038904012.1 DNA glycosylase/AP lyase ROS1-like [Benincasa hispida]XP_038904013.1 DNA glycosylase/AP lyase ROS1-like [Benincasa hispida]XP_038904014.1 DNA glycosylase/AP lyase ROS1-like [Benincasa hispida]